MIEPDKKITISDGRFGIVMTKAGQPSFGIPTQIELQAGPFSGAFSEEIVGFKEFFENLKILHESLKGSVGLSGLDYPFNLDLTAHKLGQVIVKISATPSYIPKAMLEMEFQIDQSYLPAIISQLENFLQ